LGLVVSVAALVTSVGCGDDGGTPADVAGSYTVALTKRDNGCKFTNWTPGQSDAGVPVVITQSDDMATADVMGVGGAALNIALGSSAFTGPIAGNHMDLDLFGNKSFTMGNCAYTYNAKIDGDIANDTITGRVEYTAKTNSNPDCADLEGCLSYQDFNGTRPPT
jgi:hypothetical protein